MKNNFDYKQKIIALVLLVFVVASTNLLAPKPVHAQWATFDVVDELENALSSVYDSLDEVFSDFQYIYEYVLNPLAWAVAKDMLQQITNSTVQWINSGFQGSPSFVSNPSQFFQQIGDNYAGQFIAGLASPLVNLCSPINLNVRLALALNQANVGAQNAYSCTLSQIINNVQGATINGFEAGDFSQGGWPAFVSLAEPQNSFYGAYLQAQAQLSLQQQSAVSNNQNLLAQGNGFLSFQECSPAPSSQGSTATSYAGEPSSSGGTMVAFNDNATLAKTNSANALATKNNKSQTAALSNALAITVTDTTNQNQQQNNRDTYNSLNETVQQDQQNYNQCVASGNSTCATDEQVLQQDQTMLNNLVSQYPYVTSSNADTSAPASSGGTAGCQLVDPDTGECLDNSSSSNVNPSNSSYPGAPAGTTYESNGNYYDSSGVYLGADPNYNSSNSQNDNTGSDQSSGQNPSDNSGVTNNTPDQGTAGSSGTNPYDSQLNQDINNYQDSGCVENPNDPSCQDMEATINEDQNSADQWEADQEAEDTADTIPDAPPGAQTDAGGQSCITTTPGTVIANSLNQAIGNGQQTLIAAHDLDEIIGALFAQLVNQVLNKGLSNVSQPSGGQPSYLQQLQQEAATQGEGGNIQQLSSTVSSDLSTAINYGNQQQQEVASSLSIAESATTTLDAALATCEEASDTPVIAQVNILVATTSALTANLQNENLSITGQLNSMNLLDAEIQAATSSGELQGLAQQYQSMVTSLPSPTTVQNATTENGNVQSQISDIESQAATLQKQCVMFETSATSTSP